MQARPLRAAAGAPAPNIAHAGRAPAGARGEILNAIDALHIRSGSELFTVHDVAAELERRGTRYALSTITTMITSHMCLDGPSPTQWPDLRRVDRGVYRRAQPDEKIRP
jgi:hypothetical protein